MNMSEHVKEITDAEFAATVKSGITLVDFWAPWCGPCQMMSPILEKLGEDTDFASICKINVDENTATANEYGVQSIPTLIFFKDGKEMQRMVGAQAQQALKAELAKLK